jgi:CheY-like chemotaxis protein
MSQPPTPKNIVLYADDDPDDLQLVSEAFSKYASNVDVVTVHDGTDVLKYLDGLHPNEQTPCLVILDINMPMLNGKDTLARIRRMNRFTDLPVVIFTTSSQPLDASFATQYQAGFITKPLDARQMEMITDQFIEHCTDEIRKNIRREREADS